MAVVDGKLIVKTLAMEGQQYILKPRNATYETIRPGASPGGSEYSWAAFGDGRQGGFAGGGSGCVKPCPQPSDIN